MEKDTNTPAFLAWKKEIETGSQHEGKVRYREVGPNYNKLDFDDKGYPKCVPVTGPHFVDAAPAYGTSLHTLGKLLGTFNHLTQEGKIYFPKAKDSSQT